MKKTLLAAVIAASFGFTAAHADTSLPAYNADGNPVSVVLFGTLDLQGVGTYHNVHFKVKEDSNNYAEDTLSTSNLGYNLNEATLGFTISSSFMNTYNVFSTVKVGLGIAEDQTVDVGGTVAIGYNEKGALYAPAVAKMVANVPVQGATVTIPGGVTFSPKLLLVGVSNDDMGTLTVGYQNSASDDLAYNGFGDYDLLSYAGGSSGVFSGVSLKYVSPEFNGVTVAASLATNSTSAYDKQTPRQNGTSKTTVTHDDSVFDLQNLSLGVQYVQDALTVAATADVVKHFETDNTQKPSDLSTRGQVAFTLGAGYAFDDYSVFANVGYVNNADWSALGDLTFTPGFVTSYEGDLYQVGGQLGGSYNITADDVVNAALQYGYLGTKTKDGAGMFKSASIYGFKVAASHQFNSSFSAYAFTTFNYVYSSFNTNVELKDKTVKVETAQNNYKVQYGVGLKYEF